MSYYCLKGITFTRQGSIKSSRSFCRQTPKLLEVLIDYVINDAFFLVLQYLGLYDLMTKVEKSVLAQYPCLYEHPHWYLSRFTNGKCKTSYSGIGLSYFMHLLTPLMIVFLLYNSSLSDWKTL